MCLRNHPLDAKAKLAPLEAKATETSEVEAKKIAREAVKSLAARLGIKIDRMDGHIKEQGDDDDS